MGIPFTGDDNERDARVFTAEDGLKHTPRGLAVMIQRMKNRGLTNREIAGRIGRTPQAVEQYLVLVKANSDVKAMVTNGEVDA
jgi:predicted transcriptional regulator